MSTTHPAVELTGVSKAFGPVRAVDDLTVSIPAGRTVALLGPNGAGKSTAIGVMLGLLPPDTGTAAVFGLPPGDAVRAGLVGAMPQEGGLIQRVTIRELLTFVSGTYRSPMPLDEVLATAHLTAIADRRVDRLSGGQGQRVRFAMALAGDPGLLVLDEPTAALDVAARNEFWQSMRRFARDGKTILFSTHYLEEADQYADRVVVLNRGQVVADGTSDEIKRIVALTTVAVTVSQEVSWYDRLPGVTGWEIRGDRIHMRSVDSDATVYALAVAGAVHNLEVTNADLEDAFLALTSGTAVKEHI